MATAEDIFWVYEPERFVKYQQCANMADCPNNFNGCCDCYENSNSNIIPLRIGMGQHKPHLNVKTYIRPNQECPICLDPITHRPTAYLSVCGHGFHKECISKTYVANTRQKCMSQLKCPICRHTLGNDIEYITERYTSDLGTIDSVENFWNIYPHNIPTICRKMHNNQYHTLGCNNTCSRCLDYRNTGTY